MFALQGAGLCDKHAGKGTLGNLGPSMVKTKTQSCGPQVVNPSWVFFFFSKLGIQKQITTQFNKVGKGTLLVCHP